MKDDKMREAVDFTEDFPKFNKNMKGTHKILIPDMLPVHFGIIVEILRADGWDIELLRNDTRAVIDEGLKHVHNDTCYPALCVTGQFIDALKSGKYDVEHTAAAAPPIISRLSERRSKRNFPKCPSCL